MNLSKTFRCAVAALLATSVQAGACEPDMPAPSFQELTDAETAFAETESALTRVASYKTMLATRDPDLRNTVLAMGLSSGDDSIRAAALRCKFLTSASMTTRVLTFDEALEVKPSMTDAEREIAETGLSETYPFFFVDWTTGCASINGHHDDVCKEALHAAVSDLVVSFYNDRRRNGRFVLTPDNRLLGELGVWNGSGHDMVPAELFLN